LWKLPDRAAVNLSSANCIFICSNQWPCSRTAFVFPEAGGYTMAGHNGMSCLALVRLDGSAAAVQRRDWGFAGKGYQESVAPYNTNVMTATGLDGWWQ
jgi:hypothetical protein